MEAKSGGAELEALPTEERVVPVQRLHDEWKKSLDNPEDYWAEQAKQLDWFKTWDKVLDWKPPFARWFDGALLNVSYNCVDRHVKTWRKNKAAILWEGEPGDSRVLTYNALYREVNALASALKKLGVKKGDFVAMYMPMLPELPIAMLACSRIGAPFTQIYSGFSAAALAERVRDTGSKALITADGAWRRGKIIELKRTVDEAVKDCPSVEKVIAVKRTGQDVLMQQGRDLWYADAVKEAPEKYVPPEPLEASHTLYVLYTSGTTAKPKGVQVCTGGYLTYICSTLKWSFDVNDDDVWWCAADIGWVTGHSYIVFAPLARGLTEVMYEGAPDYPDPGRTWSIVEKCGVTKLYTSPTLIRMLIKYGDEWPKKYDLGSLTMLGSVGEPINPEAWRWYYETIGGKRCAITDTWWQTETGGFLIAPAPGIELVPLKPGSATLPLPGIDPEIVDEEGRPLPKGAKGNLVIRKPWPGMLMTLFKEDDRYKKYYWDRYPKAKSSLFYTGDYAVQDNEGYYWLLGRSDDVIKVAGHRLGTIELEDVLVGHPAVAEAAVAGKPDPIKGEVPVCFVVLKVGYRPSPELAEELKQYVRNVIGPVATPSEVHLVPMLPKTRSGKIMRRVIRAIATDTPIGDATTLEDEAAVEEVTKAMEDFKKAVARK